MFLSLLFDFSILSAILPQEIRGTAAAMPQIPTVPMLSRFSASALSNHSASHTSSHVLYRVTSGLENDYLHATIHCVSCSFFCSKRDWLHFFFRTDCRSLLSISVFLCFQERYSVWRNRRIEQGSMLHHLSFCCLSGKLCLRKNPHLL